MNVLLIIADALRADRLGCYGCQKSTSPHIDRLAREGVRFENCVATATHTSPSMISILTGTNAVTHGLLTAQGSSLIEINFAYLRHDLEIDVTSTPGFR